MHFDLVNKKKFELLICDEVGSVHWYIQKERRLLAWYCTTHATVVISSGFVVGAALQAHQLKNGESQICKAVNGLESAKLRLLLTGTPIQNDLSECACRCPGAPVQRWEQWACFAAQWCS